MPLTFNKEKKRAKKDAKETLEKLIKKRDAAVKWREDSGWDDRYKRAWNYYYFGTANDISDTALVDKQKKREANYIFSNIESIIPKIFDKFPGFQVIGRTNEDVHSAPVVEEVLKYEVQRLNIEALMEGIVRDMLIPAIGYLKLTWGYQEKDKDKKKKKKKEEEAEDGYEIIKDELEVEVIDPQNIWITAGDKRLQDAEGVFERIFTTKEEAKARYGKDLEATGILQGYNSVKENEKAKGEVGRVCLWRYEGRCNGKKMVWYFTDDEVLDSHPCYEHGHYPYSELSNYRNSQEYYPWSEVYQLEKLQDEIVEIDEQSKAFRKRGINPKKVVEKGNLDNTNMSRLKNPKMNVVEANDINKIKWEMPAMIGQDIYAMRNIKKEDIGLMTGQSEISRGGTERVVKTATGQQILFDAAQGRVRHKVRALEQFLKEVLFQMHGLIAQFQDAEGVAKISDDEENPYAEYTKEDIAGNYDFILDIVESTPFLREKRGQLALQAYEMFREDKDIDQAGLKKKVLKLAFQDIHAEELLVEPEEVEEIKAEDFNKEIPVTEGMLPPPALEQPLSQEGPPGPATMAPGAGAAALMGNMGQVAP